jgi:DNA-binding IclR family transcriptional regulator
MSGLNRFVELLGLFNEERPHWTIQDISQALTVPASTLYRTVRELLRAGFLETGAEGQYRLGPTIIVLDRLIRLTDPLIAAGEPLLEDVVVQARMPCVAVFARLYNDIIICIADASPKNPGPVYTTYRRGHPRPLTRGASSKMILSQLPTRRLSKLLAKTDPDLCRPPDLKKFREELAVIRKRGYCITRGEVDKGLVGIAVPIWVPEQAITASLSLAIDATKLADTDERRLVLLLISTANLITEALRQLDLLEDRQISAQ